METSNQDETPILEKRQKLTRKERREARFKKLLDEDPKLKSKLLRSLEHLSENKIPMPLIHITSKALSTPDGKIVETGFIENIKAEGFRSRDTNVSAFVRRNEDVSIGTPEYFINNPQSLVRELSMKVERYKHHGIRVNKQVLSELPEGSRGVSVALVISAENAKVERATDYDDHYILTNELREENLIGQIDLENQNMNRDEDLKAFVSNFADALENLQH